MFNVFWGIDFENLYSTFFDVFGIRINRKDKKDWNLLEKDIVEQIFDFFILSIVQDTPSLLRYFKEFKDKNIRIVEVKAYADFVRLIKYPVGLFRNDIGNLFKVFNSKGIIPVQSFAKTQGSKTLTDISLVVDVISEVTSHETTLDGVLLFIQDADFTPLIEWLLKNTRLWIIICYFGDRISRVYNYYNFGGTRFMLCSLDWVSVRTIVRLINEYKDNQDGFEYLRNVVKNNVWFKKTLENVGSYNSASSFSHFLQI